METCTYGLGADIWKPTTERWQGAEYRAYWYNGTPSSVFAAFADNRLGVLFGGLHLNSVSDVSYAVLVSFSSARRSARWTALASTPNSRLCILMQCPSLVPSLKALKESFSMKDNAEG